MAGLGEVVVLELLYFLLEFFLRQVGESQADLSSEVAAQLSSVVCNLVLRRAAQGLNHYFVFSEEELGGAGHLVLHALERRRA